MSIENTHGEAVQKDSRDLDGSAEAASPGAPCVEYGWLECPPNWHEAINSGETFAALVAEHQAWRVWYITKEAGAPKAQLLAEAVIKAFHAAQAMSRAQAAALSQVPSLGGNT